MSRLTINEVAEMEQRHVERKSWPLLKDQPDIEADGYRHWCRYCRVKWPCDARRLLDAMASE